MQCVYINKIICNQCIFDNFLKSDKNECLNNCSTDIGTYENKTFVNNKSC